MMHKISNTKHKPISRPVAAILIVCAVLLLTAMIEVLVFNYHAIRSPGQPPVTISLDLPDDQLTGFEQVANGLEAMQADASLLIFISSQYVKKMELTYETSRIHDMLVNFSWSSSSGQIQSVQRPDSIDARLSRSVTNINHVTDRIEIIVRQPGLTLTGITLSNPFQINGVRVFFLLVALTLLALTLFAGKLLRDHFEWAAVLYAFLIGTTLLVMVPLKNPTVWDDDYHFHRIYWHSFISEVRWTEAAQIYSTRTVPAASTLEEKQDIIEYLDSRHDWDAVVRTDAKSRFIPYNMRNYLPQSAMLALARILGVPFYAMQLMGRLGGMLFYLFLVYWALKTAATGKRLICAVALLPTPLYMAATYSYDPHIIGMTLLGFSAFITEYSHADEKLSFRRAAVFVMTMVFAAWCKAVYVPLILLGLLLPSGKFESKKHMWLFKAGIVTVFLIIMSSFMLPTLTNPSAGGDFRGGATSVAGQIAHILQSPLGYLRLLAASIWDQLGNYFFGAISLANFAYLGVIGGNVPYMLLILLIVVTLTDTAGPGQAHLKPGARIWLGLLLIMIICLIWTALYLSFTPVGLGQINGVQGRYYLPLLVPLLFALSSPRVRTAIPPLAYNRFVLGTLALAMILSIYTYILVPFNV